MSSIKSIRERLGVTQAALAEGMGCTQANISFYEKGQTVPPDAAKRLIGYALTLKHEVTFNDIYDGNTSDKNVAALMGQEGVASNLIDRRKTERRAQVDRRATSSLKLQSPQQARKSVVKA